MRNMPDTIELQSKTRLAADAPLLYERVLQSQCTVGTVEGVQTVRKKAQRVSTSSQAGGYLCDERWPDMGALVTAHNDCVAFHGLLHYAALVGDQLRVAGRGWLCGLGQHWVPRHKVSRSVYWRRLHANCLHR